MNDSVQQWMDQADYDLETARAMLQSKRLLYVLFCCQQAVEKALKGVVAYRTDELPPRTHNLTRLAELAGLQLNDEDSDFIARLSATYMQSRYPSGVAELSRSVNRELSELVLSQKERMIRWLRSTLT